MADFLDVLDVGRDTILAVCAYTLLVTGLAGCILPILPGVIIAYGGVVCAYFYSGDSVVSIGGWSLVVWLVLTLLVTILDYFLPAYMARVVGGSKAGQWGATVGLFIGLVGSFFIPLPFVAQVISAIAGPMVGAILGEVIFAKTDFNQACKVGVGSFCSFIVGTGVKLIVTILMFAHVTAATIATFV